MFAVRRLVNNALPKNIAVLSNRYLTAEAISIPKPDTEIPVVSAKIGKLVDEISQLTLLEVSELSVTLKRTLNLPDAPVMSFGAIQQQPIKEEDEEQKVIKTSFAVKLMKFDETKKVALIKEVKSLLQDMNLVQAKKFVESAPAIVKADIGKDEAEKIKTTLETFGAECVVE